MIIGNLFRNEDEEYEEDEYSVSYNYKRYIFFLQKEYMNESIPVEEESFLRAVDFYIEEEYPKITDSNIKKFHHKLFRKCNQDIQKYSNIKIPKAMIIPIKKALT